jgi:hypothetical protein
MREQFGNRYASTVWWFWYILDVIDNFFPLFPYLLIYRTEEVAGSNPAWSTTFFVFPSSSRLITAYLLLFIAHFLNRKILHIQTPGWKTYLWSLKVDGLASPNQVYKRLGFLPCPSFYRKLKVKLLTLVVFNAIIMWAFTRNRNIFLSRNSDLPSIIG